MGDSETAKNQLREYLSSLLVPRLSEGFWSIHASATKLCEQNKQSSETLRTFQNLLTKIPEWSDSTLSEEVERILKVSKCPYIDDILMGVFLAYMKSFAALQYRGSSSQVKVEFDRPNITKFVHELYKHSARKLWQVAYLFKGGPSEQQAKNRQEIEQTIHKTLDDVIRAFLPWEIIAKSYFSEVHEETAPPPSSKSVLFEGLSDVESDSDSDSDSDESVVKPRSLSLGDDLDLSALDIQSDSKTINVKSKQVVEVEKSVEKPVEKPVEKQVEKPVLFSELEDDVIEDIESKVGEDTLVLNL
jgi:hypothetical protein